MGTTPNGTFAAVLFAVFLVAMVTVIWAMAREDR